MVTAREAFEAKKLASKYGSVGKVAASYRTAGYKISENIDINPGAKYNFIASKKGEKLVVKVYEKSSNVPVEVLDNLASAAKELGGKPLLVLYGAGPKLTGEIREKAKELGVSIRRLRM
ncbi:MAG: hypothetical protein GSR77_05925 [Desulfurococcales archaeon]|nr:hypothetical protein [Desulfurococcales archaeon]